MAKAKTIFFCKECGYESAKWMGQCPGCKEWNTFVEEPAAKTGGGRTAGRRISKTAAKPAYLSEISIEDHDRMPTGFQELDSL